MHRHTGEPQCTADLPMPLRWPAHPTLDHVYAQFQAAVIKFQVCIGKNIHPL